MSANDLRQFSTKSDRVLMLTASCIRTALRLRFGVTISFDDALDLSRLHDVRSAVNSVGAKLQVHENLPERVRIDVAVTEAKLSNTVTGADSVDHVIKVRTVALGPGVNSTQTPSQRESFVKALLAIRREASQWASEYQHFSAALTELYRNASRQLQLIPLTPAVRTEAMAELETILSNALQRASRL